MAPNAYADAVAKAYLRGEMQSSQARRMVAEAMPEGRVIHTVQMEGGAAYWPETRFTAVREAIGWWVRRKEQREAAGTKAVDPGRIGEAWAPKAVRCWEEVWEQTGARTVAVAETEGQGDEDGDGRTLVEAAEAAVEGARGEATESAEAGNRAGDEGRQGQVRGGDGSTRRSGVGGRHKRETGVPSVLLEGEGVAMGADG